MTRVNASDRSIKRPSARRTKIIRKASSKKHNNIANNSCNESGHAINGSGLTYTLKSLFKTISPFHCTCSDQVLQLQQQLMNARSELQQLKDKRKAEDYIDSPSSTKKLKTFNFTSTTAALPKTVKKKKRHASGIKPVRIHHADTDKSSQNSDLINHKRSNPITANALQQGVQLLRSKDSKQKVDSGILPSERPRSAVTANLLQEAIKLKGRTLNSKRQLSTLLPPPKKKATNSSGITSSVLKAVKLRAAIKKVNQKKVSSSITADALKAVKLRTMTKNSTSNNKPKMSLTKNNSSGILTANALKSVKLKLKPISSGGSDNNITNIRDSTTSSNNIIGISEVLLQSIKLKSVLSNKGVSEKGNQSHLGIFSNSLAMKQFEKKSKQAKGEATQNNSIPAPTPKTQSNRSFLWSALKKRFSHTPDSLSSPSSVWEATP